MLRNEANSQRKPSVRNEPNSAITHCVSLPSTRDRPSGLRWGQAFNVRHSAFGTPALACPATAGRHQTGSTFSRLSARLPATGCRPLATTLSLRGGITPQTILQKVR